MDEDLLSDRTTRIPHLPARIGLAGSRRPAGEAAEPGRRWVDVVLLAGLTLLACAITGLGVYRAPSLSMFDEATHIDYVWSIAHGTLPHAGSEIAPQVRQEWSCRGQDNLGGVPTCGQPHPAAAYPASGQNYNFGHPPTYYALTALAVRTAGPLPLDFVTVARGTGAAWLAAALAGLYLVLRMWRVPRFYAAGAAVLLAAVPSVAHASSIVTNDAPAALAGVAALWVLTRIVRQEKLGWLLPTALTLLIASMKVMNAAAMLAVAGVGLVLAASAFRRGDRARALRLGGIALGIAAATGAVQLAWTAFQATRATPGWVSPIAGTNTDPVLGTPVGEWLPTLFSAFGLTQSFWVQDALTSFAIVALARWLAILFTAAPFANVAAFARDDARRLVGWTAMVGCAAVPLIVQLQAYHNNGEYFPDVSTRYALSLLPLTIAALALVAHARRWRVATAVLAGGSSGALLLSFAGVL